MSREPTQAARPIISSSTIIVIISAAIERPSKAKDQPNVVLVEVWKSQPQHAVDRQDARAGALLSTVREARAKAGRTTGAQTRPQGEGNGLCLHSGSAKIRRRVEEITERVVRREQEKRRETARSSERDPPPP